MTSHLFRGRPTASGRARTVISGCAILALLSALVGGKESAKVESFDRDPGWDGARNRVKNQGPRAKKQAFGYQKSNQAGKAAGEIGGVFWRDLAPAWYGKKIGPKTFDDAVSASGTLALTQSVTGFSGFQNGGTIFIGFFNPRDLAWRPTNFIGFRLEASNDPRGASVELSYGTSKWTAGGTFVNTSGEDQEKLVRDLDQSLLRCVAPDGAKHTWEIRYDPKGGGGHGQITLVFDGVPTRFRIGRSHREQGATFDHFGVFAAELPGDKMAAYFDDFVINGEAEDFSKDPRWDAAGNDAQIPDAISYGENDFGFDPKGKQIGGRFWRVEEPQFKGHYGGNVGKLTFDDKLSARGKLRIPHFSVDSGAFFGFYNSKEQGWPPKNFVGVYMDSLTSNGRFATPMYGTAKANRVSKVENRPLSAGHAPATLWFEPGEKEHEWTLDYDPTANGGNGAVTFTIDGKSSTLNLAPGHKAESATFDRFGMFNMQDNNGKDCVIYLDDLSFTTASPD